MKESRVMDDSDSEEDEEAAALLAARKRREAIIARHKAAQKELQKVSPAAPEQDELEMNEEMPVDTLMRRADDDGECSEDDEHKVNAGDVDERLMNEDRDHRRGPVFDIFGDAVEEVAANGEAGGKAAALDRGDNVLDKDNWDDADGYYKFQMGEMMHDRYSVYEVSGKGVFSNVLRAKDCKKEGNEVCIKICLLYTSDAADEEDSVDLGGRRIIKKKKKETNRIRRRDKRKKYQIKSIDNKKIWMKKREV
eukprot:TRINITY_DN15639_c0_g1_i10.p1 TRINITY_DN15639_c0_g1~~TRINITY_DN15639_c0_g1_i10.p1  ORF type:complete len:251 (+),score=79.24 TRINITY_DN15639_c0_g1_i10:643-1395(+)